MACATLHATAANRAAADAARYPVYEVAAGRPAGRHRRTGAGAPQRYRQLAALNRTRIPDAAGRHGPDHLEPEVAAGLRRGGGPMMSESRSSFYLCDDAVGPAVSW